ncbi:pyridoxamine 5'-phosphate oxidase family protein [Sedimentitalea sp. XS_ASV28]|uniref:pyridoxamine 5'-phosphate oxidase family protein n=1 Tax=Sedimentitalea sp. XS_ASV28 TaxID=3241296 RepID=UPI003511C370
MEQIDTIEALEALYGTPSEPALRKVARRMTPTYRKWIMASRLCVLTTVGEGGTDGSPRGDDGPVVQELDPGTLAMPDWHGNNRLDSLRNIVKDGRVSLMFMVAGSNTVIRVNGSARLTADAELRGRFERKGRLPTTVIVISIDEIYCQCARALLRAGIWQRDDRAGLPTIGDILAEMTDDEIDGKEYDRTWTARATKTLW